MSSWEDWRNLTAAQRTPWINFHRVYIADNPTDPIWAMAWGGPKQVNFLSLNCRSLGPDNPPSPIVWPRINYVSPAFQDQPYPQVWISNPFPAPSSSAVLNRTIDGSPMDRLYKPHRCWDTGVARRRRNYTGP